MSQEPQQLSPIFQIDVSAHASKEKSAPPSEASETHQLLRQLVIGQERQTELMEELVDQLNANQRQRATELGHWKQANPDLARKCRAAAEALSEVQTEFLQGLTDEVTGNFDCLLDGEFMLNEFVDRYGPRLAHLNGVLQVLSQLSSVPSSSNSV